MNNEKISLDDTLFSVIGCGSIGKRHIANLQTLGVKNISAVDLKERRRKEVETKFGVSTFKDIEQAISAGTKVAFICTPTRFHLNNALIAARAGCHLFIEKPVSNSLDGLDELQDEIKRNKLITLIGCNFRFHPGLKYVKRLLEKQAIGKVTSVRAQFGQYLPDWHPWEDYRQGYSARLDLGGGVVLDRIHEVEYLRWLLGEIKEIYAIVDHISSLEIDTEDIAEILVRFSCGSIGSIHLDYIRPAYDCSMEIIGESGLIKWNFQDNSLQWYLTSEGQLNSMQWPNYDGNQMYLEEIRHFLDALQGIDIIEHDIVEGIKDLKIAIAAKHSSKNKRVVII